MSQIFRGSGNNWGGASIVGVVLLRSTVGAGLLKLQRSPYVTNQHVAPEQPVPFSHQHHVAGLGLDCRYCHTSVEQSSFAGIPPTKTCLNCHAQICTNAALLEPVRYSFRTGQSLQWTRVHDLPDFVYFNHSIHLNKGVGCESCHGRVEEMPLRYAENSLRMECGLNCHREPEKFLRPRDQVFSMTYPGPSEERPVTVDARTTFTHITPANPLKHTHHLRSVRDITSCATRHR